MFSAAEILRTSGSVFFEKCIHYIVLCDSVSKINAVSYRLSVQKLITKFYLCVNLRNIQLLIVHDSLNKTTRNVSTFVLPIHVFSAKENSTFYLVILRLIVCPDCFLSYGCYMWI